MSYAWQINQDDTHSVSIVTYSGNVITKTLAEVKQLVSDAGFNCAILTATNYYHSTNSYMIFTNFGNVDSDLYLASNTYLSDSEDEKIGYSFPNTTGFNQYQCFVLANDGESLRQVTGTVFNNFSSPVVVNNITYQRINHQEQMSTIPPIFITTYEGNIYIDGVLPSSVIASNGGGATHIAKRTGQLKDLSSYTSDILMVSGGGGGGTLVRDTVYEGADAGGIAGSGNNSANQSTGNAFGQGESGTDASGGGSGLYGGYSGRERLSGIYSPSKLGNYQLALPLYPETLYNGNNIINYAHGSFDSYFDTYGDYLPNTTTVLMDNEYMTLTCTIVANDYQRIDVLVKANNQTYQLTETQSHTARDQIPAGVYFIVNENTHSIRCGTVLDDGWYLRIRQSSIYNYSDLYNAIVNSIPVVIYSAGAGSGYIGNSLLSNKKMVGYNVPTSDVTDTKTESVQVYSASGEENKPKAGNGMARITFLRSS